MKPPKGFVIFLVLAQAILTAGHFLLYQSLVFFFPWFALHWLTLLITLMILSISFLTASIFDFQKENAVLRIIYIASAVWLPAPIYFLLAAGISLVIFIFFPGLHPAIWAAPIFSLAVVLTAYGAINARIIHTVKINVKLPNLPDFWRGKTAVLASDMHLGHVLRQGFANKLVAKINKLKPDLILIPGDFFDGVKTNFAALAEPLKNLRAAKGVYYCSGNHELYAGMEECKKAVSNIGINVMDEKVADVDGLQIAGIGYEHDRMPDFADKLKNLQIDVNRPSILLKHVPLQLEEAADAGVSLQVSGHTHKGQLWPGPLVTKRYFKGYDYGFKNFKNMQLIVSSGAGTWGPPVRLMTQAEIVQITFI